MRMEAAGFEGVRYTNMAGGMLQCTRDGSLCDILHEDAGALSWFDDYPVGKKIILAVDYSSMHHLSISPSPMFITGSGVCSKPSTIQGVQSYFLPGYCRTMTKVHCSWFVQQIYRNCNVLPLCLGDLLNHTK